MKVLFKMPVKTSLKIICVTALSVGALVSGAPQSFSQEGKLVDPGYGLHIQGTKKKDAKKTESGLTFTMKELNDWRIRQRKMTERYELRVGEVMGGRQSIEGSIPMLRIMYPRASYYDPFSKFTTQKMTAFAYAADMSSDQHEVNEALVSYRDLLYKHIVNLGVVEYALTLARANPIYGDKLRLKKIYDALIKDTVGRERHGASPEDAYRVVTYAEETYLLAMHDVTVKKSEIYRVAKVFYNVHDTVDEDEQYSQLYFDVTWPIYLYEKNKATKDSEGRFFIPQQ